MWLNKPHSAILFCRHNSNCRVSSVVFHNRFKLTRLYPLLLLWQFRACTEWDSWRPYNWENRHYAHFCPRHASVHCTHFIEMILTSLSFARKTVYRAHSLYRAKRDFWQSTMLKERLILRSSAQARYGEWYLRLYQVTLKVLYEIFKTYHGRIFLSYCLWQDFN